MQDTTARPPWAKIPPLIIRLPEQSRRQPRASKAQSGDIVWDKPRRRAVGGPGGQRAPASPAASPASPGPSARPAPAPARAGQSAASRGLFAYAPPRAPGPIPDVYPRKHINLRRSR